MRRAISLLLSLVMLITSLPMEAFAEALEQNQQVTEPAVTETVVTETFPVEFVPEEPSETVSTEPVPTETAGPEIPETTEAAEIMVAETVVVEADTALASEFETTLTGQVLDGQGSGLADVTVAVYDVAQRKFLYQGLKTDDSGSWSIDDAWIGDRYIVSYYKPGYTFPVNDISVTVVAGGVTAETVSASILNIEGLVCNEADYTYTTNTSAGTAAITGYTGSDKAISLPGMLGGYPVTAINAAAFQSNSMLETVVFSDAITTINKNAFQNCSALKQVYFPNTLTMIDAYAFQNCAQLKAALLPIGVKNMQKGAFQNCTALAQIRYPMNWTYAAQDIFAGCTKLTAVTIPEGIETVPDYAFYGCAALTQVQLPESLLTVGKYAFSGCAGLKDLQLPKKLTAINEGAFQNCTALERVQFPENLTTLKSQAFQNCSALTQINYPLNVTTTGSQIFAGTGLTEMTVPEGILQIPSYLFDGAAMLQKVMLPSTLTTIGSYAFRDCAALASVELPAGMIKINGHAFQNCTGLTAIHLPDGINTIGDNAFMGCTNLADVNYPMSLSSGYGIFDGCKSLTHMTVPEGVTKLPDGLFYGANGLTSVSLPDSLLTIGSSTFSNCYYLTEITIPQQVTKIEPSTFYSCGNLSKVNLHEGITSIGARAFAACAALESIVLPDAVTSIGDSAFESCVKLKEINIPLSLSSTGEDIFRNCAQLPEITVPEGITALPYEAFKDANYLQRVHLPSTLTSIGGYAFAYCSALEEITIPEKVTSIGNNAFTNCEMLRKVTLPEGLTTIGKNAFWYCRGLEAINLPDSLTTIGEKAFWSCMKLETVHFPQNLTSVGTQAFRGCTALHTFEIPEGVTAIPNYTFEYATGIKTVRLPSTVQTVGKYAFSNSSLEYLILPDSVTTIGDYAFQSCAGLLKIWVGEHVTSIGANAFKSTASVTIHGVEGSYAETFAESKSIPFSTEDFASSMIGFGQQIVDADGKGIAGVCISVYDLTDCTSIYQMLETDENGTWSIPDAVKDHQLMIQYHKAGYTFPENTVYVTVADAPMAPVTAQMLEVEGLACNEADFTYTVDKAAGTATVTKYTGTDTAVQVPSMLGGYPVAKLDSYTFSGHETLETVVLPDYLQAIGFKAFVGCTALKQVYFPGTLTTVDRYAFDGCTQLEVMDLPHTVKTIGEYAFNNCTSLSQYTYPFSLTTAASYIFEGCTSLTEITVPDGVTTIVDTAFSRASQLKKIHIPDSVQTIGEFAFNFCSGLTEIDLPDGLKVIDQYAFNYCTGLTSVTLPEGLSFLGKRAFVSCTGLRQINYPANMKTVESEVFYGCTALTNIVIPEGVTSLPNSAFINADGLKTVTLPSTLISVGTKTFSGCDGLKYVILPDSVTTINNYAFQDCPELLQIWIGENVTSIGASTFSGCTSLTIHGVAGSYAETYANKYSIPFSAEALSFEPAPLSGSVVDEAGNGVADVTVSIYDETDGMYVYTDLLTAEDGSWSIADAISGHKYQIQYSKLGCNFPVNGMTVIVAKGGTVMEPVTAYALADEDLVCNEADFVYTTNALAETATVTGYTGSDPAIQIPEKLGGYPVTAIGEGAFRDKANLRTVVFPGALQSVGKAAFENCTALQKLYFSGNLLAIGENAFRGCTALEAVQLPDGVKTISAGAFRNCAALNAFTIPTSWSGAGEEIFAGTALTELTVPEGITALPDYAFAGAAQLQTVNLPTTLTEIGISAFDGCAAMIRLQLPDSVARIEKYAFRGCAALTEFTCPISLTWVGEGIFDGCTGLKSAVIPEDITKIPYRMFQKAGSLEQVQLPTTLTEVGDYAFEGCTALKELTFADGLLTIGAYAFSGCTGLRSVDLPDSVQTMEERIFYGCINLEAFDYPLSLTKTGGESFAGCRRMTSVTVPEGVTAIPDYLFKGANWLKTVNFPDSLTSVGKYAFSNCDSLRVVDFPMSVVSVGEQAFSECGSLRSLMLSNTDCYVGFSILKNSPNTTVYCANKSEATMYAVENQIPFVQNGSAAERTDNVLDSSSDYYTELKSIAANGYLSMTVHYSIKESIASSVSNRRLYLVLPQNAELNEESLLLDGELCTNYSYDNDRTLLVPVSADSGTLKFSMEITKAGKLYSYAALQRKYNGYTRRDVIGIMDDQINVLTLNVPSVASESAVSINGIAPPSAMIDLYVDGVQQTSVKTSKAGNWNATIEIPDPKENYTYTVYASCSADGQTMQQSAKIVYRAGEAKLTKFVMMSRKQESQDPYAAFDLLHMGNVKPSVGFGPTVIYDFEVGFDHPDQIEKIYVTSTRNHETKYLEAVYNEATGTFLTSGRFDENNPNYVPGVISIQYTKHAPGVYVEDAFDWSIFDEQIESMTEDTVEIKTNTATDMEATIDLGSVYSGLKDVAVDTSISIYDAATDGDLGEWLGVFKEWDTIASYVVPGYNDEKYFVSLDYSDPYTTVMLLRDATGSKFVKMTIQSAIDKADDAAKAADLMQISSTLSGVNTIAGLLLTEHQISQDMDALREEVWANEYESDTERKAVLKQVDALERNQKTFALMTAVIPLVIAAGVTMTGPALLLTGMLGVFTAVAPAFWEARTAQIKGQKFRLRFFIDPSGYVYDIETGERIQGVKTTVFCVLYDDTDTFWDKKPADTFYGTKWNAEAYDQANPLYTDVDGKYAWDVPEGWWRVKYEKDGYLTTWSEWLPVPPPQTEVNIGMTPGQEVHVHEFGEYTSDGNATCLEDGTKSAGCLGCEVRDVQPDPGTALGHQWDSGKVTLQPTQDKTGIKTYTCTRCGETKEETLDKLPEDPACKHQNTEKIPAVDATCTTEGKTEGKKCSDCGEILTAQQAVPKIDHTYGEWTVTVAPTGAANGKESRACEHCGAEQERSVGKLVNPFEDVVEGKFYFEPVLWAFYGGITTGKDATHFNPSGFCTRSQVVTFLWRAAGQPEPASSENPFPDVPEGKFYTKAVLWAVEQGITAGYKDGTFGPNDACTRGQIVTFLWRYFGEPEPASSENPFPDVVESKFYYKAVLWAVENGITGGFKDGTFGPNKTCTRDQIVTFLYRAMV